MLTEQEQLFVKQYVDDEYYDRKKLISYLNMHTVVGNEVFAYCDRHKKSNQQSTYSRWLNDEDGYIPLSVSAFLRRVPFYFFVRDDNGSYGSLDYLYAISFQISKEANIDIERIYISLEYMFYSLKLPLDRIFSYWVGQTGQISGDDFFKWDHYLHLCEDNGILNYYPECFITAYNEVLEASGLTPIIYEISEIYLGDAFFRSGTKLEFEGRFPYDKDGNPIMKWIGIKATNVRNIGCTAEKSRHGRLWMEITPNSVIHVLNFYNNEDDREDIWYQVYAGPKTMQFDYSILKERRKKLGLTQQQVAEAIDTTVRTYQKWETGETTPNGHYLIRLLNWLDIIDIQNAIEYIDV